MTPPGTATRRVVPRFHYELIVCGVRGHELVGTDAAAVRPEDAEFVREANGRRWHRCLRCDSWVPLPPPAQPLRESVPTEREVELPTRGKALRDKIVLRLIAIDRAFHVLLFGTVAVLIFVFASHRAQLQRFVNRIDEVFYGAPAGHLHTHSHGVLHDLERLATLNVTTLRAVGAAAAFYAVLEGAEAVGLWFQYRWAEYLTFVATAAFLPVEVWELTKTVSTLKVLALLVNVAILVYLLFAKRLFGLRGGAAAEAAERARDSGWEAFHDSTPPPFETPAGRAPSMLSADL